MTASGFAADFRTAPWRLLAVACALLLAGSQPRAASGDEAGARKIPIAYNVKLESTPTTTRIEFSMTGAVDVAGFVMADPDRVILDMPEVDFRIDAAPPRTTAGRFGRGRERSTQGGGGLVASWRFGLFAPGKSRIVIDLAGPARLARADSTTADNGDARLVVELDATDRKSFLAAARQRTIRAAAHAPAPVPGPSALPIVVIDPGHGGIDSGAQSAKGIQEKDVVFEFAQALQSALQGSGRYRVLMTRTTDVFVPLGDRVKIARAAGAALFLSVHADILGAQPGVSGATVYTVSEKASDAQAARVAEQENQADAAAGLEGGESESDVNDILFDLTRRETRVYSNSFARTLVGYFRETGRLNKNPHRAAGFVVLKAPDVPSVLLELGYLSSDRDVQNLTTGAWRDKAAATVARAVDQFFQPRNERTAIPVEGAAGLRRGVDNVAAEQQ